jgi:hypothetical protein
MLGFSCYRAVSLAVLGILLIFAGLALVLVTASQPPTL